MIIISRHGMNAEWLWRCDVPLLTAAIRMVVVVVLKVAALLKASYPRTLKLKTEPAMSCPPGGYVGENSTAHQRLN
jgi:hypothetical protein